MSMLLAKVTDFSGSLCSTYEKIIAIKDAIGSAMIKPAILGYWPANQLEKAIIEPANKILIKKIIKLNLLC